MSTLLAVGAPTATAEPAATDSASGSAAASPVVAPETFRPQADQPPPQSDATNQPLEQSPAVAATNFADAVCWAIGHEALANDLPVEFFTRLIWQESRFDPRARSHVGAEGIAQFMPRTARWRGLTDTFEPYEALRQSARWLGELRDQFGNLGLAAAAYNAGPRRVQNWLAKRSSLPGETRAYVRIITGRQPEDWKDAADQPVRLTDPVACTQIAKLLAAPDYPSRRSRRRGASDPQVDASAWAPWGLQLIGSWSESLALADYRKLQTRFPAVLGDRTPLVLRTRMAGRGPATWFRIRVAESTRERATQLCAKLEAAGGKCLVLKN